MGIIVLSIAILPFLGIGGMQLYKAEIPSPVVDKLKPRISETARILWKIYVAHHPVAGGAALCGRHEPVRCLLPCLLHHAHGRIFHKNASVAHYNSAYFDFVIVIFMILAGINFSLHYRLLKGDLKVFGKDSECRVFLIIVGVFHPAGDFRYLR
jgi:trk system potassium uptake protein TrkH